MLNTFITVAQSKNQIIAIQQTSGPISNARAGTRHVAVPTDWFGQIFSITDRLYDLIETSDAKKESDSLISSGRTFVATRVKPVLEDG